MKTLLIILTCCFAINCFAQTKASTQTFSEAQKKKYLQEYLQQAKYLRDSLPAFSEGNMPNAFVGKWPEPKKVGSNGAGLDIYTLPLDNMPMVKPDNSFSSNMPVAGFNKFSTKDSIGVKKLQPYRFTVPKKSMLPNRING